VGADIADEMVQDCGPVFGFGEAEGDGDGVGGLAVPVVAVLVGMIERLLEGLADYRGPAGEGVGLAGAAQDAGGSFEDGQVVEEHGGAG